MNRPLGGTALLAIGSVIVCAVLILIGVRSKPTASMDPDSIAHHALERRVHQSCVMGRGALVVVQMKLRRGDADAVDVAKDFLAFGEPWLALCHRGPRSLDFLDADRTQLLELLDRIERRLQP